MAQFWDGFWIWLRHKSTPHPRHCTFVAHGEGRGAHDILLNDDCLSFADHDDPTLACVLSQNEHEMEHLEKIVFVG